MTTSKKVQSVVENLVKNGAKVLADKFTVLNVNLKEEDNHTRMTLTLDNEFEQMVKQDDGTRKLQMSNILFTSTYSVAGLMKQDPALALAAGHCLEHTNAFKAVLAGAKLTLLQEKVKEGTDYVNPFSNSDTTTHIDHDTVITHIIGIEGVSPAILAQITNYILFG